MKKFLVLSAMLLIILTGLGNLKANAGGCSARCKFSSCTIGGVDVYACGCYFGIAICKGEKTKVELKRAEIIDFGNFARNARSSGLMNVSGILNAINDSNYKSQVEAYRAAVESLNDSDKELMIAYLGGEY